MRDLYAFVAERLGRGEQFTTFVAVFRERLGGGERRFEHALWRQLRRLHELDRRYHEWDPRVSSDPADPNFSFSIAGNAFFVVGMHPRANRQARRFPWPALVFNAHQQFEDLRRDGRFDGLQRGIRKRDLVLQGSPNGNLTNYGEHSEARQYAGRIVEEDWTCPFAPRP
jgi:FPC/CPF motif-containing protein YcgG